MSYIICDPGSTHAGKKQYAFELIETAAEAGADCVKFQMFQGTKFVEAGNIPMPYDWMPELVQHGKKIGIAVTASVFDNRSLELLLTLDVPFIKFSYSRKNDVDQIGAVLRLGRRVLSSTDVFSALPNDRNLIKMFVHEVNGCAVYPSYFQMNYQGLFPGRFQGFSDHTLGVTEALKARAVGCEYFEKHIRLDYDDAKECPDAKFALTGQEMADYVQAIREAKATQPEPWGMKQWLLGR